MPARRGARRTSILAFTSAEETSGYVPRRAASLDLYSQGNHFHTGDYEPMAEVLFRDLDVDTFYLEFDDERSGSFQPLRHFPPNKKLVLGVVTTKRPTLEDPEEIKLRIHQAVDVLASGIIPRTKEEALNHPQCGFASDYMGNPVTEQDVRAKVGLMAKIAKDIWG
uniref:UROD/MetE-like protein n=1 Tax=Mycena chlorophos TaxID=658473 RepID=A0ABQ0LH90_MYCCL|nr:UROD/MetE-like protein [Mycena chlorophos]